MNIIIGNDEVLLRFTGFPIGRQTEKQIRSMEIWNCSKLIYSESSKNLSIINIIKRQAVGCSMPKY